MVLSFVTIRRMWISKEIVRLKTKLEDLVKRPGTREGETHLAASLADRENYRSEANRHALDFGADATLLDQRFQKPSLKLTANMQHKGMFIEW